MIRKLWGQIWKLGKADSETMIWKLWHQSDSETQNGGFGNYDLETKARDLETITADSETMIGKLLFGNYEVRFGNCSNNTRDLSSIATYNVRSTRDINMPSHPTPPHPTPSCTHRSNNTRHLCSVATYNVRSTRDINMPSHPTPPHPFVHTP